MNRGDGELSILTKIFAPPDADSSTNLHELYLCKFVDKIRIINHGGIEDSPW
jgi:hypothetical protein